MTAEVEDVLPLSFGQQALLLAQRSGKLGWGGVDVAVALGAETPEDGAVHELLRLLQERNDALRGRVVSRRGRVAMEFLSPSDTPPIETVIGHVRYEDEWAVRDFRAWSTRRFERGACPLSKAMIVNRQGVTWLHLLSDQIVCDGWSIALLTEELEGIWKSVRAGAPLPEPPGSYREYLRAQSQQHRSAESMAAYDTFWRDALRQSVALRMPRQDVKGGHVLNFVIPEDLALRLPALRKRLKTTDFCIFASALAMVLARRVSQESLVAYTHISDRQSTQTLRTVGWLINYVGVRIVVGSTFADTVRSCQAGFFEALRHQVGPFFSIADGVGTDGAVVSIEPHAQHATSLQGYADGVWNPWGWDNDCRHPESLPARMAAGEADWLVRPFAPPPLGDIGFHYKPAAWGYILGLMFTAAYLDEATAREIAAGFLGLLEHETCVGV